jgi:hypothetical protein
MLLLLVALFGAAIVQFVVIGRSDSNDSVPPAASVVTVAVESTVG